MKLDFCLGQETIMHIVHLTPEEFARVHYLRFHHPLPAIQRRMEIILLAAKSSMSYRQIAELVKVHPNTVTNVLVDFERGGTEALMKWEMTGKKNVLIGFDDWMRKLWSAHPPADLKEAAATLERITGVKRCVSTVRTFLLRLGFTWRKAGSVPKKADPDSQRKFLAEHIQPCLSEAARDERRVYFMDASHFVFGAFLGYIWCLTRVFIPTSAGRQRYNVLGAVDIIGHSLLTVANDSYITAETVCEMLVKMAKQESQKAITVFLDNARYQHCAKVMDKAKELGISLVFLPTYSPNLNLIERFWKYVKKGLTNKSHDNFTAFRAAIDNRIKEAFTLHTQELTTLLAPNFHIIEKSQFQAA